MKFLLSFIALLSLAAASCTVNTELLEFSTLTESFQAAVTCETAITSCIFTPTVPAGLSLSTSCTIAGKTKYTLEQKQFTVKYVNDGQLYSGTVTMVSYGTLNSCNYGVNDAGFSISKDEAFTILAPRCNAPVKSCTAASLPEGVKIDNLGKIYTEGATKISAQATYPIVCTDGTNEVEIPLKLSIGSNPGSTPLQYLQYPTNDFGFYDGRAASITPNFFGSIKSCSAKGGTFGTGVKIDSSTCIISGTFSGTAPYHNVTVTATSANDHSVSVTYIYIRYISNNHGNYQFGWLIRFYRFESAVCTIAYTAQTGKKELMYVGVRDYINYTAGKTLWPEYGWHLEQKSSLSATGFYHSQKRTFYGYSGPSIVNYGSGSDNWQRPKPGQFSQSCAIVTSDLVGKIELKSEIHQVRGIGEDSQFRYEVQVGAEGSDPVKGTGEFIGPTIIAHQHLGLFEYSLMKAVYPAHTPIALNKPVLQAWITAREVNSFELDKSLPIGLEFDPKNGYITGYADEISPSSMYTVTLRGLDGTTPFVMTCQLDLEIREFTASEDQFDCSDVTRSGKLGTTLKDITCTSKNSMAIRYHSTDLPKGLSLSENGVISGIPEEIALGHTSTIYGYTINGVTAKQITFHIEESCIYNPFYFDYTLQSPGTIFTIKQGDETFFTNSIDDKIGVNMRYVVCTKEITNLKLIINSNAILGGSFTLRYTSDLVVLPGKVEDITDQREIEIEFPQDDVPVLTYPDMTNLVVGFYYYFGPIVTNGASSFTSDTGKIDIGGLKFDEETGAFYGTVTSAMNGFTTHVTATNSKGNSEEIAVVFKSSKCENGRQLFILHVAVGAADSGTASINIKKKSDQSEVFTISNMIAITFDKSFCDALGDYTATYTFTSASSMEIELDGIGVRTLFSAGTNSVQDFFVQRIYTANGLWYYTSTYYSDWITTTELSSWSARAVGGFEEVSGIVRYYKYPFAVDNTELSEAIILTLNYTGGIAVYINEHFVYINNLPDGYTNETESTSDKFYKEVKVPIVKSYFKTDGTNNYISIECHFKASMSKKEVLSIDMQYMGINQCMDAPSVNDVNITAFAVQATAVSDGTLKESVLPEAFRKAVYSLSNGEAFTYDLSSYNAYGNTWFKYIYKYPVMITQYYLSAKGDSVNHFAVSWDILGSNDDKEWSLVHSVRRTAQVILPEDRPYFIPQLTEQYKYYLFNITARGEDNQVLANRFRTAGMLPLVCNYPKKCDDIPMGSSSYFMCPEGQESNLKADASEPIRIVRECRNVNGNPVLQEDDYKGNTCSRKKIVFETSTNTVTGVVGKEVPTYRAFLSVDRETTTKITSNPELPAGIKIDQLSGRIYGIPTEARAKQAYTITVTNNDYPEGKKTISATVNLEILNAKCKATEDGVWPETEIGKPVTVPCGDMYFGEMTRECILNENGDTEWTEPNREQCSKKAETNCRYSSNEVSFNLYDEGSFACICDVAAKSIEVEPKLPSNWKMLATGSIEYVIDKEFDILYTITFISSDDVEQIVKLRISSYPALESCTYGLDNEELKLYKMGVEIAPIKCVGYYTSISVSSSTPLPDGLVFDGKTGAITGYLKSELPTEGTTVNVVVAGGSNSITVVLKFKKNDESNLAKGFRAYGLLDYEPSQFNNALWDKLYDGSKRISGPTTMKKSVYEPTTESSPDLPGIVLTAVRAEGYLKIAEAGKYWLSYKVDDNGNIVIPGFKDIKTPTTGYADTKYELVSLNVGYNYAGFFLGFDKGQYEVNITIKKESEPDASYKDMDDIMYHGGFIIQHVDYSSFTYIVMPKTDYKILPTFQGIPSKWKIVPSIQKLSFDTNTGIISGQVENCDSMNPTTYRVTAYSDDGMASSSDTLRIICIDSQVELLKGLSTTVYTVDSPTLDSFTDPTTASGVTKILETIDNPNHVRSDDIWDGFSVLTIYSFIADYIGFIKVEQPGDYIISMKCYDYCRLYLPSQEKTVEITGSGYDIKTLNVNFEKSSYYNIRITYTKGSNDIEKQLEVNILSTSLEIEYQSIDKFLYHYPKTSVEFKSSYFVIYENEKMNDIELNAFQIDLTDAKFKVSPTLPTGLSLSSDGKITGSPSRETDLLEYKVSVTFSKGDTDSTSIWIKVLKNEKSELKYVEKVTASTGSVVKFGPTNFTNCIGFTVTNLPSGFTINSKTGFISGKGMIEFKNDITVTCLSSNPVTSSITLEINGCGSGSTYFTFGYQINSYPEGVSFKIGYDNLVIFPPENYDVEPEAGKYYEYGSCISSVITYNLNIKCLSSSGFVKLYYGELLVKYIEFSSDTSYSFIMKDHSNEKPRFEYPNKNVLGFVKNLKMTFSPVLVYNGANEYGYVGDLPDGISFDSKTGALSGTLKSTDISSTLRITATNSFGDSDVVVVNVDGITCPNEGFKISLISYSKGLDDLSSNPYYSLSKSSSVLSYATTNSQKDLSNLYCLESGVYKLTFGSISNSNEWKYSEVFVSMLDEDDNEETIVRDYYRGDNSEGNSIEINLKKYLSPSTKWSYSDTPQTSKLWKDGQLNGDIFEGPEFNEMTKITRYYTTQFDFGDADSTTDISSFVVNLKFEGGMILYINGDEYYRYNLPSGEITSETPATANNDLKNRKIKGPVSLFNMGINTIAIELHRTSADKQKDTFISRSLYISSGLESCIYDLFEVSEIVGNYRDQEYKDDEYNEKAEHMIDGKINTKMYLKGAHNDAYLNFKFTEDYFEYFNSYLFRSFGNDRDKPTREVYIFDVYGEDESNEKYLIGSNSKAYNEQYKRIKPETISTTVPLKPMRSMKIEFQTDSNGGEISDLLPAICNNMCLRDGKWSPAYIGTKSKINCGFGTEAADERECMNENGSPIWGDEKEICSKTCYDEEYGVGVPGGESKLSNCGNGYNGYTYRYCSMVEPVEFSEIKKDKCIGWYPASVTYPSVEGYVGKTSITIEPTLNKESGLPLSFRVKDGATKLPNGLELDGTTGVITGTASEDVTAQTYHMTIEIIGTRTIESEFDIVVKAVQCPIDSGFPASPVSDIAVEISCGGESENKKKRTCSFDTELDAPKWGIIDASACESSAKPVVVYENEGKMVFKIDVESSSKIPEKTDVTELKIDNENGDLKETYGLTFDIATGQVYGKCTKEAKEVEYKVTPYNGETVGNSVTIKITCQYGKPDSIIYDKTNVIAYINGDTITIKPTVVGHVSTFEITPNVELEAKGIVLDTTTGIITVNAKSDLEMTEYTIRACNEEECTSTKVSIDLRYRKPESVSYPQKEYVFTINDNIGEIIPQISQQEGVEFEIIPLATLTNIGLKFDSSSGKLEGTVKNVLSKSDFTLKAHNRDGETMFTFSFAVGYGEPPDIKYTPDNVVVYATKYTLIEQPAVSNDPYLKFTIKPELPTGLTIIQSTGRIEGTFDEPFEEQLYTVTVKNDLGEKTTTITIRGIWPAPEYLYYSKPEIKIVIGTDYKSDIPSKSPHITSYTSEPPLPNPFVIDQENGVIYTTGTPISVVAEQSYVIIASNEAGKINTTITIAVTNKPPVINGYTESAVTFVIGVEQTVAGPIKAEGSSVIEKFGMNTDTLQKITTCGLVFNENDGSISGSATSALESTNAQVYAMNDGGDSNYVDLIIMISEAPPSNLKYNDPLKLYIGINNKVGPIESDTSIKSYRISDENNIFLTNEGIAFKTDSGEFSGQTKREFEYPMEVSGCDKNGICAKTSVNIKSVNPPPGTLGYPSQTMKAIIGEEFSSGIPVKSGVVTIIKKGDNFPSEFELDENTGEITGKGYTTRIYPSEKFKVISSNPEGDTETELSLSVIYPKPTYVKYTDSNFTFTQTEYSETSVAETDAEFIIEYSYSPVTLATYGLEFDKTTGKISGTATKYTVTPLKYTITATNANGTATTTLKIIMVYPAPKAVKYENPDMIFIMGTTSVSEKPTVTGTATSFEIDPDVSTYGLKFDRKTGQISGSSEIELKKTAFKVKAVNEKGSAETDITITINYPKPTRITYGTESMKLTVGQAVTYKATISAGGYTTGYTVTVKPELPNGLEIDEKTGTLQGAATELSEEAKVYTITVTNSGGSVSTEITISVLQPLVTGWKYNVATKPNSPYTLLVNFGEAFDSGIPTYQGHYDSLSFDGLATLETEGFTVDESNGRITGIAKNNNKDIKFNIIAKNSGGSQQFGMTLSVYYPLPKSLSYTNPLVAIVNEAIEPANPKLDGEMHSAFSFLPTFTNCPGLSMSQTGVITGTTTTEYEKTNEISYGNYDRGYVKFNLTVISTKPSCLSTGEWPVTNYGSLATIICKDPQIGFKTRYCYKNNVTGAGEWGSIVDGCIEPSPVPENDVGKVLFNITLQGGKAFSEYTEKEVVAIAEVVVKLINKPEVNVTNVAVVIEDATVHKSRMMIKRKLDDEVSMIRAKVVVTASLKIAKEVRNEISTLSDSGDKVLSMFVQSSNNVINKIDIAEVTQATIVAYEDKNDDESNSDDATLYIIIGASCGGFVLILIVICGLCCYCRMKSSDRSSSKGSQAKHPKGVKA